MWKYPLIAGVFLLTSSFVFSFCPRITWVGNHIQTLPSPYASLSWASRCFHLFDKWDVGHYLGIALNGYNRPDRFPFFPAWPFFLRLFAPLVGGDIASLSLVAAGISGCLWVISYFFWGQIIKEFPWITVRHERFLWLYAFYPTTIFNIIGYAESFFLAVSGWLVLSLLRQKPFQIFLAIALLAWIKHISVFLGLTLVLWALLWKRSSLFPAAAGYLVGTGGILLFYFRKSGDPFIWARLQSSWGRHLAWPHEVLLDTHGKGIEMILYAGYLFVGPAILLYRARSRQRRTVLLTNEAIRCFSKPTSEAERANAWLCLVFCMGILTPVWFGGSVESLYRIIYLVPYLVALLSSFFSSARQWKIFCGFILLMNLHATYRYAMGLHLN